MKAATTMALRWVLLPMMVLAAAWSFGSGALVIDPSWWQQQLNEASAWQARQPLQCALAFVAVFALLSALTVPGCAALALLAGPAFGTLVGTLLVGLGSTLGALLSFLVARHLARAAVQRRWGTRLCALEGRLARGGPLALLWLRLLPVVPYPLLNPLLGLTRMPVRHFLLPSLLGLTLGSLPYVWLGQSAQQWWRHGTPQALGMAGAAALLLASLWWLQRRRAQRSGDGT